MEGEGGEVSPTSSRKLEKGALIWKKNSLIVVNYGYISSFKMIFLGVSRGKARRFFPCRAFLSRVGGEALSECLNLNKTPLP